MTETKPAQDHVAAAAYAYRRDLETVERDLVAVLRHHASAFGVELATIALVEVLGGALADIVAAQPSAGPRIAQTLGQLQLYVSTVNQVPQ